MWDPAAYSLHWQSIALTGLRADASDAEAAADVSLVSGKVSPLLHAHATTIQLHAHASADGGWLQVRSFATGASSVTDVALAPTGALVWRANDWCVCVCLMEMRRQGCKTRSGRGLEAAALALVTRVQRSPLSSTGCQDARGPTNRKRNKNAGDTVNMRGPEAEGGGRMRESESICDSSIDCSPSSPQ